MKTIRPGIAGFLRTGAAFGKWALYAIGVGILVGAVGAAFHIGIDWAAGLRAQCLRIVWLLPVGGVAIVLLYRACGMEKDRGTNLVLAAVREAEPIRLRTAPLIFLSTIITHLVGGSAGREGAALQLGGSLAACIGRKIRLDAKDGRVMVMCGMSAAFSALFGTPITAAVFSMEVVSVGVMYYAAIVPCLISAQVGLLIARCFGLHLEGGYLVPQAAVLSPWSMLQAAALGALCALVSIVFCVVMHRAPKLYERCLPSTLLRAAVGGGLVLLLTLLVGNQDFNGAGDAVIRRMLAGETIPEGFLLKILFTALTLGAGFRGGRDCAGAVYRLRLRHLGGAHAGPAPRLFRGAGHGGSILRGHQLPPHLHPAGLRAVRRGESALVRAVLRRLLYALRVLWAVQRAEDCIFQIPPRVDRQKGGVEANIVGFEQPLCPGRVRRGTEGLCCTARRFRIPGWRRRGSSRRPPGRRAPARGRFRPGRRPPPRRSW